MKFYEKCFEARLELTPFAATPGVPAGAQDRIMHARLIQGSEVLLMASDTMPGAASHKGKNFSIALMFNLELPKAA